VQTALTLDCLAARPPSAPDAQAHPARTPSVAGCSSASRLGRPEERVL